MAAAPPLRRQGRLLLLLAGARAATGSCPVRTERMTTYLSALSA